MWVTGFHPSWPYLALLPVLTVNLVFILGLTFVLSAVVPFFLDIRIIMDHVLRALFFLSGIFFVLSEVPEPYQSILRLNPMSTFIEMYRTILIHSDWPNWQHLGLILLASLALCAIGTALIRRFDCVYPKLS